ncbi:MAG: hypothetical protein HYZ91_03300 [Candidatus Omnitrophica bacterium]|nr:hypothetical protein [Candidatus Omnitrophota bacterium]
MNVGLPGTGLGGLFYLLTALLMPLLELAQTIRGRSNAGRWRRVATQCALAIGILAGLGVAGLALDSLCASSIVSRIHVSQFHTHQPVTRLLGMTPTLLSLITLSLLLAVVEFLHLMLGWSHRR